MDFFLLLLRAVCPSAQKAAQSTNCLSGMKMDSGASGGRIERLKERKRKTKWRTNMRRTIQFPVLRWSFKRLSRELVRECFIFVYCRKPFLAREKEETFASVPGMHLPTFCHLLDSTWDVLRAHVYDKSRLG